MAEAWLVCSFYRQCLLWEKAFFCFLLVVAFIIAHALIRPGTFEPLIKKDSLGKSFPSRHVFSATTIAMFTLLLNPWLGGTMLFLAAILAILRVLGGVHYPSDVLAGYVIGILVGLLLYL